MGVAVITDGAAALPPGLAAEAVVVVLPMWLTIGGTSYREDQIALEELVARLDEGVTTSGPSPGEFREAIEANLTPEGAVVLTVSRRVSGVHGAALLATRPFGPAVRVIDTGTAAGGQGLVALAAAAVARAGGSLDEVEAAARRAAGRVRLVAALERLDRLVRGGHVPGLAAWAGRTLGLRPLVELRAGRIRPLRPARSQEAAIERMVEACLEGGRGGGRLHAAAMHALAPGAAERLLVRLRAAVEPATAYVGPFSSVMVAHTGPGLVGLAWWWEEAEAGVEEPLVGAAAAVPA